MWGNNVSTVIMSLILSFLLYLPTECNVVMSCYTLILMWCYLWYSSNFIVVLSVMFLTVRCYRIVLSVFSFSNISNFITAGHTNGERRIWFICCPLGLTEEVKWASPETWRCGWRYFICVTFNSAITQPLIAFHDNTLPSLCFGPSVKVLYTDVSPF